MLAIDLYQFRNYMEREGISFCYSGYMTEDTLFGIGEAIKRKLEYDEADKKTTRRVFAVFVEQVQNVIRYSADDKTRRDETGRSELRYGVLTVGQKDGAFFVACGNKVRRADVPRLSAHLREIQGLEKDQLKARYKETLRGETPEGSKGAGVGFLDIARQSAGGIEFDFADVDDDYSFFTFKAFI